MTSPSILGHSRTNKTTKRWTKKGQTKGMRRHNVDRETKKAFFLWSSSSFHSHIITAAHWHRAPAACQWLPFNWRSRNPMNMLIRQTQLTNPAENIHRPDSSAITQICSTVTISSYNTHGNKSFPPWYCDESQKEQNSGREKKQAQILTPLKQAYPRDLFTTEQLPLSTKLTILFVSRQWQERLRLPCLVPSGWCAVDVTPQPRDHVPSASSSHGGAGSPPGESRCGGMRLPPRWERGEERSAKNILK